LTPLPMVYRTPIHGILTPLPMVYRNPTHGILTPYPWYFDPPIPKIFWFFVEINKLETRIACGGHVNRSMRNEQSL
jgi:hypothetical protein